jgi:DNA invertase Pin-like site-specific DNA recombinase
MTLIDEYVDTGISGAKDRRPELDRLLTDAHRRRFDSVVVWRFDRFARSVSHLLSTPAGKLVFTVLGAVAELERSLIAERVKAGLRNARAKGKRLGRPRSYVDAVEIQRLRTQGASWRAVGAALGVSAATALHASRKGRLKMSVNPEAVSDSV